MTGDEIVYIVDDDDDARDATAAIVAEMGVRTRLFASAEEFLELYDGHRPACLVTDVRMLRMSGLELQEELAKRGHNVATVVLTAYPATSVTVRAIKNGAVTLLEKPCSHLEQWDAIRTALAQDAAQHARDLRRLALVERLESLTPPERRVFELVVAGTPNKVIAHRLEVSIRTVEVRRQAVFLKLGVHSVAELVRVAMEVGAAPD